MAVQGNGRLIQRVFVGSGALAHMRLPVALVNFH
jgi:hypothetical protein